jgi:hypothetical protein
MRRLIAPTAAAVTVRHVPQWADGSVEIAAVVLLALGFALSALLMTDSIIGALISVRASWRRFKHGV